jgi:hypothetical protein
MELVALHIERIVVRKEYNVPSMYGAVGLCSAQYSRMKWVEHDSVAQEKGKRLGLISL